MTCKVTKLHVLVPSPESKGHGRWILHVRIYAAIFQEPVWIEGFGFGIVNRIVEHLPAELTCKALWSKILLYFNVPYVLHGGREYSQRFGADCSHYIDQLTGTTIDPAGIW